MLEHFLAITIIPYKVDYDLCRVYMRTVQFHLGTQHWMSEYQIKPLKDENSLYQQVQGVKKHKAMFHY
jgi:hypothetical protein